MQLDKLGDFKRTHRNGELRMCHAGQSVKLLGWCRRARNLGSLIFIDIRDRWGVAQLVADENQVSPALLAKLKAVRSEYVIGAEGAVAERESKNPNMPTGDVEIRLTDLKIFNTAQTPPIPVEDSDQEANEDLRLRHRFLDLRREKLQRNLVLRSEVANITRSYFRKNDFIDFETPILGRSTPEGARDYLVPSRVQPGEFFALPQSPQLYKQLLQVSGFERYIQICRCFRDEDLRADRQPEFTQIDVEMSFVRQDDIQAIIEGLMAELAPLADQAATPPFPRLSYKDAMEWYATDKPDLRCKIKIQDATACFANSEFNLFRAAAESNGQRRVRGIFFPGGQAGSASRKQLDEYQEQAKHLGAGGLPYIKWGSDDMSSSFKKFVTPQLEAELKKAFAVVSGGLLIFAVGTDEQTSRVLGDLRTRLAKAFGLLDGGGYEFLWIVDFPLLQWDDDAKRFVACHHPFTSPHPEDIELLATNPGACRAQAYDLVLNGYEIGGGSIRIHDAQTQSQMFSAIGMTEREAKEKFGFLLEALSYGAPPHGGIALGLDRLAMLVAGCDNIREVIAFPKTAQARCLMTEAPNEVDQRQLDELRIQHARPQEYRAGVMFFETVPTELQAPLHAMRQLAQGRPSTLSTLTMEGEIVNVETTNLGGGEFKF
jgi:aspartyl-tRNA synthetase